MLQRHLEFVFLHAGDEGVSEVQWQQIRLKSLGIRTGLVTHVDDLQVLINHAGMPEEQIALVNVQHSLRNAINGIQEVITKRLGRQ